MSPWKKIHPSVTSSQHKDTRPQIDWVTFQGLVMGRRSVHLTETVNHLSINRLPWGRGSLPNNRFYSS
nr:hypothetical protein Q903MT_gene1076 [Picea sitchensis]